MLTPPDGLIEGQSPTRWFIVIDDERRPVTVHRLVDMRRFTGKHLGQVYDVAAHGWDVETAKDREAIKAAIDANRVLEVDEALAHATILTLIGDALRQAERDRH